MEFTPEQITELISEITNGEQGFQGLVKQGLESLMHSERAVLTRHITTLATVIVIVECAMTVKCLSFGFRVVVTAIFTRCY